MADTLIDNLVSGPHGDELLEIVRKTKPTDDEVQTVNSLVDRMVHSLQLGTSGGDVNEHFKAMLLLSQRQADQVAAKTPYSGLQRDGYSIIEMPKQRVFKIILEDEDVAQAFGCNLFVGNVPVDMFEDELVPLFEPFGRIYQLRVIVDQRTKIGKGYVFVSYFEPSHGKLAQMTLNGSEVRSGKQLTVKFEEPKLRLFVANIPKKRPADELKSHLSKLTAGLVNVIVYEGTGPNEKNRGFCFLDFASHKDAEQAKKKLSSMKVFGCDLLVDWAEVEVKLDAQTLATTKTVHIRNLPYNMLESELLTIFRQYGNIKLVKKVKNYAFIEFRTREAAVRSLLASNGKLFDGKQISMTLAKPLPTDEEVVLRLKARQARLMSMVAKKLGPDEPVSSLNQFLKRSLGANGCEPVYPFAHVGKMLKKTERAKKLVNQDRTVGTTRKTWSQEAKAPVDKWPKQLEKVIPNFRKTIATQTACVASTQTSHGRVAKSETVSTFSVGGDLMFNMLGFLGQTGGKGQE